MHSTSTVFRCAGWGCFTTLPETPILQQVLQRAPCPAWLPRHPLETSAFPPRSCFTCSAGPHSGLHGGLFIETLLAHWRYTNWGSWKTFVCKGGTVSPRRRMGMCTLHRPVLCRGFAPFPSLPECPGFPAKGEPAQGQPIRTPPPEDFEWWPHKDQRSVQLLCPQRSFTSRAPNARVLIIHFCL